MLPSVGWHAQERGLHGTWSAVRCCGYAMLCLPPQLGGPSAPAPATLLVKVGVS